MNEPIFITGAGVVSAIGLNKAQTLCALENERSGIGSVKYLQTEHSEFPVGEVKMTNAEMAAALNIAPSVPTTRTALMGMLALKETLADAKLDMKNAQNVGFISGTTVGGMDKSERYYLDFLANDSRNAYIATHDCGACTEMIADYFGGFSFVSSVSTACSSAANAIITGANMIKNGMADIMIVGGSECITKFHLNGFKSLMILDTEQCRPFDETRAGLNLGEGAAYIVLENEKSIKKRNAAPLAMLSGYGNAEDAFHQTASSENGEGAFLAMTSAIAAAGIKPYNVDYINAHGTGTQNNDASESAAMLRVFGKDMPLVSSTKSFTGHTTSACGAIETVFCILAINNGFVPANLNWKNKMQNGFAPVARTLRNKTLKHVLCNSFGFGGNDSSLLISAVK